jgi:hypothetical protein
MKIREGLARDDYSDPGDYRYPQGSVAYEVETPAAAPARHETPAKVKDSKPMKGMKM